MHLLFFLAKTLTRTQELSFVALAVIPFAICTSHFALKDTSSSTSIAVSVFKMRLPDFATAVATILHQFGILELL